MRNPKTGAPLISDPIMSHYAYLRRKLYPSNFLEVTPNTRIRNSLIDIHSITALRAVKMLQVFDGVSDQYNIERLKMAYGESLREAVQIRGKLLTDDEVTAFQILDRLYGYNLPKEG